MMLPVLFSIFFVFTSQTRYDISFNDISLLPHPLTLPGHFITFESFNLTYLELPKSFTVSYTPTEFYAGFDSNEITLKAGATFNTSFWEGEETLPVSTSIEGNLEFSRLNDASPWGLGKNCTMIVKILDWIPILKCSYFTSLFGSELRKEEYQKEVVTFPELLPNATSINNAHMIMAVKNMMKGINELIPFKLSFSTPESTGLHIEITAANTLNILLNKTFDELCDLSRSGISILHEVEQYLSTDAREFITKKLNELTELLEKITVENGPIEGALEFNLVIPAGAKIDIDIGVRGFGCDKEGWVCALPSYKGLSIIGIELSGFGDLDGISAIMPELLESMNSKLSDALMSFCDQDTGLCIINLPHDKPTIMPPTLLLILFPIVSAVLIIVIVNVNVIRHIKNPVVNYQNVPISITRIVCEDTLFCIFVAGTMMMFICSDITTAATVVIGKEITMYNFSLMNTVHDLWFGGLKPLSVFVMLFSGIYPYFKLFCMLLCTVILHCPDSRILKIIDLMGKYSYIDIFVMLIMASGLCIDNIVVAIMRPAFFLFVAATTASIIAGNYGVHLWRIKTSIRKAYYHNACDTKEFSMKTKQLSIETEKMPKQSVNGDSEFAELVTSSGNLYDNNYNDRLMNDDVTVSTTKRHVWWLVSIPSAIVIIALTLPVCLWTCLSFSVDGLAHVIFPTDRKFTILVIAAKAHWLCLIIVIYTILIAPFLNALFFPSMCFFNTWTAADVFLLACVAGLVQLNQFVQFMLGGNYSFAYSIHAHLHVTLIPLLIAAILTWVIYLMYVFNCRQCNKKQK